MDDFVVESPFEDLGTQVNNDSASTLSDYDLDKLFEHCWRRNSCKSCLKTHLPCGWCPTSQACVPAITGILSPVSDPKICPMSSERFELRTKPLNCSVSTLTALTAVLSVLLTLFVVAIIYAVIKYRAKIRESWENAMQSWGWGSPEGIDSGVGERTSLLHSPRAVGMGRRWSYWVYNRVPGGEEERPALERSDTTGDEGEAIGGRDFEERRERMLHRSAGEV